MQEETIQEILNTLKKNTDIQGIWQSFTNAKPKNFDGEINIQFQDHSIQLPVQIKKELRGSHYSSLIQTVQSLGHFMLIANYIPPKVRKILKEHEISYLDQAGNLFIKTPNCLLWIEAHKRPVKVWETINDSFTKTGVKVVFQFLIDAQLVNTTYRQIANQAGVGLGSINHIISGLKQMGFIIELPNEQLQLAQKTKLLERWLDGFEMILKPSSHLGNFRLSQDITLQDWPSFSLDESKDQWGGEVAAQILGDKHPMNSWTIYTDETKHNFIKKYPLIQDTKGPIQVYRKFWKHPNNAQSMVPILLIYADLLSQGEMASIQKAKEIYQNHLENEWE